MDTTCIICNKTFSSKQSLSVHIKTAKSCSSSVEKVTYDCEYCEKKFSSLNTLKQHINICSTKKDIQIKDFEKTINESKIKEEEFKSILNNKDIIFNNILEKNCTEFNDKLKKKDDEIVEKLFFINKLQTTIEHLSNQLIKQEEQLKKQEENSINQIKDLQDKIERLACRAIEKKTKTTVTNNTTNIEIHQILPSQEKITEIIKEKFNHDYLISGPKGVANFVQKEVIRGENGELLYKCYDASRQRFTFYNELGEEVKDYNSYKLLGMIHPEILKKGLEISKDADREYELLKEKKNKSSEEVDKMFYLKSATETQLPKCLMDIKMMKKENTFSRELSRLIS